MISNVQRGRNSGVKAQKQKGPAKLLPAESEGPRKKWLAMSLGRELRLDVILREPSQGCTTGLLHLQVWMRQEGVKLYLPGGRAVTAACHGLQRISAKDHIAFALCPGDLSLAGVAWGGGWSWRATW